MAKQTLVSKRLVSGVTVTVDRVYRTSDGRKWTNANRANTFQSHLNRKAAIIKVLQESGLMAYKSSPHILSAGRIADHIVSGTLLDKLTAAANGRRPRAAIRL